MTDGAQPVAPSLPWRLSSSVVMGVTGALCRTFLHGANRTEVHGLDGFLRVLDERQDIEGRERGLITVSNHTSVLDDPIIWGVLPLRYLFRPDHLRWGLGSYDICFKNKPLATFFSLGQVLPTHRQAHSPHGGLFQPTMTQAIRLLSHRPSHSSASSSFSQDHLDHSTSTPGIPDPFSTPHLTYTTNNVDTFPAPSAYLSRRHSWIHIFPEGKVHQRTDKTMRYFKWGVARLILEAEPLPQIVPMWIEGLNEVMHEAREAPRWVPRVGKDIKVVFGEEVDAEKVFGDLRRKWRGLVEKEGDATSDEGWSLGELQTERLRYGDEAVKLRIECTMRVRGELLKVRRQAGLPDEDPKEGLVETWRAEGGSREGQMADGSWVKDT
ncbi:MAG: hypothetical protein M1817_004543 [Caeruleum heppii]|nr:MAG: hypothetical protein M1817_004543 [Caeruleum heppii]